MWMEKMIEVRDVSMRFRMANDRISSIKEYAIARLRERHDLTTDEGKVRFLGELANLIAGLPNPVERDIYLSLIHI